MKPSLSNNEIKRIKSLSQKKFRDEYGAFVAEGEKIVDEALHSGYEIEAVYRREEIGEDRMSRISQLSSPSPVLAVIRKPAQEQIQIPSKGLFLGLDSLRDPGNLGTVIRIADWFGITDVICSRGTADVYNPKVVQATMGCIARVNVLYTDLCEFINSLPSDIPVYGTFLDGDSIYGQKLSGCGLIVMGNEGNGISRALSEKISNRLLIPNYPPERAATDSLNVAVATAIICSEFRRKQLKFDL